jgi:uncharacterized membrane protein YfcA
MISFLIGAASAITGALGFGSGCVMLICLTLRGVGRLTASGINLLFFPATGIFSLVLHHRHGLVNWKLALPMLAVGCAGALAGCLAAPHIPHQWLSVLFGVLLLVLGLRELLSCLKKTPPLHNSADKGTK